jgi:tmRNA-binding protein
MKYTIKANRKTVVRTSNKKVADEALDIVANIPKYLKQKITLLKGKKIVDKRDKEVCNVATKIL